MACQTHPLRVGCCGVQVYVQLKGLIDVDLELARLDKQLQALDPKLEEIQARVNMDGYEEKVSTQRGRGGGALGGKRGSTCGVAVRVGVEVMNTSTVAIVRIMTVMMMLRRRL
jgi:hypothetical protein